MPGATPDGKGYTLVPMAGIQLQAGPAFAVSDKDGRFLLRDFRPAI